MPKQKISEFNSNPALNTDIDSINIAEGCAPSGINDAIRELMAQLKDWQSGTSNDPYVVGSSGSLTLNQGTANGVAYLNGSKVVTSGSALTFDGTALRVTGSTGLYFSGSTAGHAYMATDGTSTADSLYIATNTNIPILFQINASEQMRLTSTGLGIGTSSPAAKLDVSSSTDITSAVRTTGSGSSASLLLTNGSGTTSAKYSYVRYLNNDTASQEWRVGTYGNDNFIFRNNNAGSTFLTLDTSGNLGLGVTPSAWDSIVKVLELNNGVYYGAQTDGEPVFYTGANNYYNASSFKYKVSSKAATRYQQDSGAHKWYNAPSGTAGNAITFTQAMTLDASGNLGIGTTSPSNRLVVGSVSDASNFLRINSSTVQTVFGSDASGGYVGTDNSYALRFFTNNTERARIDSSGNLLVGTTSVFSSGFVNILCDATQKTPISIKSSVNAASAYYVRFVNNSGTDIGAIQVNGTNNGVNYLTSSDYRLKENVQLMTGALAKVSALKPCTYTWKNGGAASQGFIAHELQEVVPDCVSGKKDDVDEEGNPKYQGIDTSHLVATLTAALQELNAKFDAYVASHP